MGIAGPDIRSKVQDEREHLTFLTCGSVDDGKSTMIGRMLFDCECVLADQFETLKHDSLRFGTVGKEVDFALLLDGLEAERQQGITIDVAYRYFSTSRRSFVVADAPGHEEYTGNMVTGASTADLAVLVVDARKGLLVQTRRHTHICALLRIPHIILAVNKCDLVDFNRDVFDRLSEEYRAFVADMEFASVVAIPLSARFGDNLVARSNRTAWYTGPTLIGRLEEVDINSEQFAKPFRLPVQWINRPDSDFRGLSGTIASGTVRQGDEITVPTSATRSRIARIVTPEGDRCEAVAGDAVTLTLADAIDVARGEMLTSVEAPASVSDIIAADLVCLNPHGLFQGRSYVMRIGTKWTRASITRIKYKINVTNGAHEATHRLDHNEIGNCELSIAAPISFDAYKDNRSTGSFILVDSLDNATVAAGMIRFSLRRAGNVRPEPHASDRPARHAGPNQSPCIVWFTGLSAAGKTTIARRVEQRLNALGYDSYMLDGDNLRGGLNRDLGFSEADRVENIRRAGEVAKLFVDAGLIVLCSFISPFRAERQTVRGLVAKGDFIEVFVDASLEVCMKRDPKGLYAKVKAGLLKNFTGIDMPYEIPEAPELHLRSDEMDADVLVEQIVHHLKRAGHIG